MLICSVESDDIFGNRAAVLVPGHCRTRVPFFLSFFHYYDWVHKSWFGCDPTPSCKPGSCHLQVPGPLSPRTDLGSGLETQDSGATSQCQGVSLSWKLLLGKWALAEVWRGWGPGQVLLCVSGPVGIWDMTVGLPKAVPNPRLGFL